MSNSNNTKTTLVYVDMVVKLKANLKQKCKIQFVEDTRLIPKSIYIICKFQRTIVPSSCHTVCKFKGKKINNNKLYQRPYES